MNNQPFATGALASPLDYRDAYAAAAALEAARHEPEVNIDLSAFPVLMQGKRPACVGHAFALLMMVYWYRKTGKIIRFSPRFFDAMAKTIDGLELVGTGTYPRIVARIAAKYGCATEDALPNDITLSDADYRNPAVLTPAVMANALQYKVPGYVNVSIDIDSMREGMRLFGPLSTLLQIDSSWWTAADGTSSYDASKICPLRPPKSIESGHQIVVRASEDDDLNTLRNSWDKTWANGGDGTYRPEDWTPYTIEAWAFAEIPADVADLIANLPAPAAFHYQWSRTLVLGNATPDEDVKFAQIALMILGYLAPVPAAELGYFGNKTAAAVRKFQVANGISPVPSSIGPLTRSALNNRFAI